jgi:hypothetical protein
MEILRLLTQGMCRTEHALLIAFRLERASRDYERVVLWLEHDRYDQFVLLRCLSWFSEHGAPPKLEIVGPDDFPRGRRFLGLGQLPPEALPLKQASAQLENAGVRHRE